MFCSCYRALGLQYGSVGFHETRSKKISSAITLRCQTISNQSASSNNALLITRALVIDKKIALCLSQSTFSYFGPHVISSIGASNNVGNAYQWRRVTKSVQTGVSSLQILYLTGANERTFFILNKFRTLGY